MRCNGPAAALAVALALACTPVAAQPSPPSSPAHAEGSGAAPSLDPWQGEGLRVETPPMPVAPPPTDPLARYADDPAYRYRERPQGPSLWERAKAWMAQRLSALLSKATLPRRAFQGLVALLVLLVVFALARLFARYGQGAFYRRGRAADEGDAVLPERLDALDLDSWVRDAVAAGDVRGAVRARYLRALLHLQGAGLLVYRPRATNADYLGALPPPVRAALAPLARRFEELWYGDYPAAAGDLDAAQAHETAVRAAATAGQRAARTTPEAEDAHA